MSCTRCCLCGCWWGAAHGPLTRGTAASAPCKGEEKEQPLLEAVGEGKAWKFLVEQVCRCSAVFCPAAGSPHAQVVVSEGVAPFLSCNHFFLPAAAGGAEFKLCPSLSLQPTVSGFVSSLLSFHWDSSSAGKMTMSRKKEEVVPLLQLFAKGGFVSGCPEKCLKQVNIVL